MRYSLLKQNMVDMTRKAYDNKAELIDEAMADDGSKIFVFQAAGLTITIHIDITLT